MSSTRSRTVSKCSELSWLPRHVSRYPEYHDSNPNLPCSEASTSSRVPSPRLARAGYWASYKLINCSESQLGQLATNQHQLGHDQQQLGHNQHQLGHTELGTAGRSSQLGHRRSQQLGHRSSGSSSGSSTAARSQLQLASCERQFSTLDTTRRLYY